MERSCCATGVKGDRAQLIRLVAAPSGELFVDYGGKLPGRGAWVVPTKAAIEAIERSPKLVRKSLRREVDATGLLKKVREANDIAVMHALTLAARSGSLVAGGQRVRDSIASGAALAAIFASNCSPRLKADIISRCKEQVCIELPLTVDELGARIGKGQRAVLIVISSSTGRNLLRELDSMLALR